MRSHLVLTGGPAVGKSTTARLLALATLRSAVVDRDDPPPADHDLDVTDLTIEEQTAVVTALWSNSS
jgi:shikimate kinase